MKSVLGRLKRKSSMVEDVWRKERMGKRGKAANGGKTEGLKEKQIKGSGSQQAIQTPIPSSNRTLEKWDINLLLFYCLCLYPGNLSYMISDFCNVLGKSDKEIWGSFKKLGSRFYIEMAFASGAADNGKMKLSKLITWWQQIMQIGESFLGWSQFCMLHFNICWVLGKRAENSIEERKCERVWCSKG